MKTRAFPQMKTVIYQDGKPIYKTKGTPTQVKTNTKRFFDTKF